MYLKVTYLCNKKRKQVEFIELFKRHMSVTCLRFAK